MNILSIPNHKNDIPIKKISMGIEREKKICSVHNVRIKKQKWKNQKHRASAETRRGDGPIEMRMLFVSHDISM